MAGRVWSGAARRMLSCRSAAVLLGWVRVGVRAYLVVHTAHEDLTRHFRARDAADEHLRARLAPTPQLGLGLGLASGLGQGEPRS